MIGDRFFPADDYLAQSGVEAMMPGIERMGGGGEEMFIEDTATGLQPVFEAKIGAIDWGAMAPSKDEYDDSDDDGGSMGTSGYGGADAVGGLGGLENFVETSKKTFRRNQKQVCAPHIHFEAGIRTTRPFLSSIYITIVLDAWSMRACKCPLLTLKLREHPLAAHLLTEHQLTAHSARDVVASGKH